MESLMLMHFFVDIDMIINHCNNSLVQIVILILMGHAPNIKYLSVDRNHFVIYFRDW
jgi:hypothetical protein